MWFCVNHGGMWKLKNWPLLPAHKQHPFLPRYLQLGRKYFNLFSLGMRRWFFKGDWKNFIANIAILYVSDLDVMLTGLLGSTLLILCSISIATRLYCSQKVIVPTWKCYTTLIAAFTITAGKEPKSVYIKLINKWRGRETQYLIFFSVWTFLKIYPIFLKKWMISCICNPNGDSQK